RGMRPNRRRCAPPPAEHRRDADVAVDDRTETSKSLQAILALRIHQVKNPGTFNQITRSKPSRIRQKTMEPFEANLLKPNRRATLFSGKEVDRSAYTQSDSSDLRAISNMAGENLLLRHSHCEKN